MLRDGTPPFGAPQQAARTALTKTQAVIGAITRGLGRPAFRAALSAALLVAASVLPVTAAGPTSLVNADVSPTTATTTTTITFAVTFRNSHGAPPAYVRVRIGGAMHDMHPTTGSQDWKKGGRFAFTTKLKAGTYDVTFFAADQNRAW